MAEAKKLGGAGLRGQVAGETALCTVGKTGTGLTYRGYDVSDLADNAQFEEVAYLLLRGKLPTQAELDAYKARLKSLRTLPDALKLVLEQIPKDAHPMDVMRTGCSMLGNLETEQDFSEQDDKIDRMLATFPAIITYWYRFAHEGVRIDTANTESDSIGGVFLELLHGKKPSELHEQVMNVSLILYAEHEFNASTFTARVCASTLSDIHSCVTGAIGSLRGPLHGGANEAAMELIQKPQRPPLGIDGSSEPIRPRERRGTPHVVLEQLTPFGLERGGAHDVLEGALQLRQRRDQRLRHEATAEIAVVARPPAGLGRGGGLGLGHDGARSTPRAGSCRLHPDAGGTQNCSPEDASGPAPSMGAGSSRHTTAGYLKYARIVGCFPRTSRQRRAMATRPGPSPITGRR